MLRRVLPTALAATAVVTATGVLTATAVAEPEGFGPPGSPAVRHVRLLGERAIPHGLEFGGTTVGGLSGLDRDPRTGEYYLISDDRSDRQPARVYTARIDVDARGLRDVRITGTRPLRRPDGTTFPPKASDTPDPEAIRVDPADGTLYWTSEGDRIVPTGGAAPTLIDPFVRQARRDGTHVRELRLPDNLRMSAEERGPRRNAALEGLALTADGRQLVAAMEGPLHQDGQEPSPRQGAMTRLTFLDKRTGRAVRQLAYPVEPVFAEPRPAGAFANNGVVEVLAVDRHRYLVMERSFVTGVGNRVRVYEVDARGATDVLGRQSLADGRFRPVRKRLVVDLADLPLSTVDNVEGMAWGPTLPTGERVLVLVSDDNFAATQVSQVVALAVR
ncbi:hypothetical protein LX15_005118 [Streptoalloteichus tenebrarius]|uniref:Phytase-like domain-containing protein n=1 Tax=Streptoalloteichus tenebrarius (strain ATCC 17920 / DSM 40477 / JCM 4838 / CBS 697.72 / NBRC 16177 / NCIMB 11028 / NRRL B-12390 / A12253. 1 / ISP 5477) TaxID=1933 RepID=A0ABT1I0T9_STRSD|nr:esterase-like activity of phytase family protein [Streptoalloteichus tenebrarius]MCP2261392.1 hypothetical protein [Streptoalloteichus tenebrarius]